MRKRWRFQWNLVTNEKHLVHTVNWKKIVTYAIKTKQGIPDWEMGGVLCHVSKKADLEECGISKNLGWQRDISLLWFYIL